METVRRSDGSFATTTAETSLVFVINSLAIPLTPVLTLLACLVFTQTSLRGSYFIVAILAFLLAGDFLGPLQVCEAGKRAGLSRMLLSISARWLLMAGFIVGAVHLAGLWVAMDVHVIVCWLIATPLVLWAAEWSAQRALRARASRVACQRAVIVGATELGVRLEQTLLDDPLLRTDVAGYFDDRSSVRLPPHASRHLLGTTQSLAEYVSRNPVDRVFITLPMSRDPRIVSIIDALRNSAASVYFVPDLLAFDSIQARFDVVNGIPVVAVCETPFQGLSRALKRLSDILIASAALLLVAPIFIAVAIGVRCDSPGPVLFRQKRYGLNGREILVCKFRSMTVTEDGKSSFTAAVRGDSRITRFGAFIRRTSLDELPQLLNVLEGTMSIVGPRPHTALMNEHYRRLIPGYMVRHKVKPGITGWAQVNGQRGGDDLDSMRKRIEFDLEYLRSWSLWFDARILMRTVAVVLTDDNAY